MKTKPSPIRGFITTTINNFKGTIKPKTASAQSKIKLKAPNLKNCERRLGYLVNS